MTPTTARRILLIEDDPAWAELTREAFSEVASDTHVEIVHDGEEAIRRLESGTPPDLVLLDLNMPGTDGRDVMRTIRSLPNADAIHVMILSASVSARDRALAGELGVEAYANKPTTFTALCRLAKTVASGALEQLDVSPPAPASTPQVTRTGEPLHVAVIGSKDLGVASNLVAAGFDVRVAPSVEDLSVTSRGFSPDCIVITGDQPGPQTEAVMRSATRWHPEVPIVLAMRWSDGGNDPPPGVSVVEIDHAGGASGELRQTVRSAVERGKLVSTLRERQRFFDAVLDTLDIGVVACDRTGTIRARNHAASLLQRVPSEGPVPPARIVAVADSGQASPVDEGVLQRALQGEHIGPVEIEGIDDRGVRQRWVMEAQRIEDDRHEVIGAIAVCRDVTDRRRTERVLTHQAQHDPLTGLPNRALAFDRLQRALERGVRRERPTAVLFVDLDGFKDINDTAGHAAGDIVLQTLAQRLQHTMRSGDTVARLGGDEFIVLSEAVPDQPTAEALASRLQQTIRQPIPLGGRMSVVTASIGVVLSSEITDAQRVVEAADAAMYEAKRLGRAQSYVVVSPGTASAS